MKSPNKNKNNNEKILFPPEQSEFPKLLEQAKKSENISSKCFALLEIKKLLLSLNCQFENNIDINQKNELFFIFSILLNIINKNLNKIGENIEEENENIKLLRTLLDVYNSITEIKNITSQVNDEKIIADCFEKLFTLANNKVLKKLKFYKQIKEILNKIGMNLLKYFNSNLNISSLIEIMLRNKNEKNLCEISVICLSKIIKIIDSLENNTKFESIFNIKTIFNILYKFYNSFSNNLELKNENDKNILNVVESLLTSIIKKYPTKNIIEQIYNSSLDKDMKKNDKFFQRRLYLELTKYQRSINNNKINSKVKSKVNNDIINKNEENKELSKISDQTKRIQSYKNKINKFGTNSSNDENKRINSINDIKDDEFKNNNIELNKIKNNLDKIMKKYNSNNINH